MESTSNDSAAFIARLERALTLEVPYPERPPFEAPRRKEAAVTALFSRSHAGDWRLLLIRRTDTVATHKGQFAFPGGGRDAGETLEQTALRELEEELGIAPSRVRLLGSLPELWTVSDYWVKPFVGLLEGEGELRLQASEVQEAFFVSWDHLQAEKNYRREFFERGPIRFPTHVYDFEGRRIWGATGAMIKNLLDRWLLSG